MHRSEDDYLLTTKLFCGKCGAMMTGVIGTSHTSRQYRYYKCNHSKQGKCDKKTVKKEWLEELVLDEIKELLSSDEVIEELADRIYELQLREDNTATSIQAQLTGVETKLNNLVEAITQGIYSSTTKKALDELEERKRNLEIELFEAQTRNPVLTKEQILFALYNFRKIDISTQEGKQRLIDGFVNSIYLYDDHFVITYNYKGQSKTVTFEELNSSPLTSKGSPLKTQYIGFIVFHSLYVASFLFTQKLPQNLFMRLGAIASKKRMAAALLYSRLPHMDALSFLDIQTGVAPLKIRKKNRRTNTNH